MNGETDKSTDPGMQTVMASLGAALIAINTAGLAMELSPIKMTVPYQMFFGIIGMIAGYSFTKRQ